MAKTKAAGSTKLGRDSEAKRLGVKLFAGEFAYPGNIIIRQRGTRYIAGRGVRRAGDDSLYAIKAGKVSFKKKAKIGFDRKRKEITLVEIE
ncbi:MAG: 50S ribosomal protein L27 [Candidatus Paceibacteria bacterium]